MLRPTMLLLLALSLSHRVLAVWPHPQSMQRGNQTVRLSEDFDIKIVGQALQEQAPADLHVAIARALHQIQHDDMQRLQVGRGESDGTAVEHAPLIDELNLSLRPASIVLPVGAEAQKPYEEQDESYHLRVETRVSGFSSSTAGSLYANTTLGLIRGLQTFTQLVYTLPERRHSSKARYIIETPIVVKDAPAYPHRAFMLDTSRNFYPVSDLVRTLDAMSYTKLNVLHWHATDSQSWPLFIPAFPHLNKVASYSSEAMYSRADILYLQEYAAALGISILLEIDVPGHTASVAELYPEHVACVSKDDEWPRYSAEPPTGQLKLGHPATTKFAQDLVGSAAQLMSSPYFSTGGDEVNRACYQDEVDPDTSGKSDTEIDAMLSDFVTQVHERVRQEGKTPVVWEEMALHHNIQLRNDTIVTVWISSANVRAVAEKGYRIIHAASDFLYLDCGMGGWIGNVTGGSKSWCDPFKSWSKIYSFDPFANLTSSQRHLVLGGEALLWSEQASPENLDSLAWPRAAAAAEVFWTGAPGEAGDADVLPRLHDWRYRVVQRGIRAAPLQPHYCALRPGVCDARPPLNDVPMSKDEL